MKPVLVPHELQSELWLKLKQYFESELAERRSYNDGKSLDPIETAFIRGDIDRLKKLIAIG